MKPKLLIAESQPPNRKTIEDLLDSQHLEYVSCSADQAISLADRDDFALVITGSPELETQFRTDDKLATLPIILISPQSETNGLSAFTMVCPQPETALNTIPFILKIKENYAGVEAIADELAALKTEYESFIYSISHDLMAPLRAIRGFSQILAADHASALDESGNRMLTRIQANAEKLATLIEAVLQLSRTTTKPLQKEPIDMESAVKKAINAFAKSGAELPPIDVTIKESAFGDKALMDQVWMNLIGNAIKFTKNATDPKIEIGSYRSDENAVFFVKDNGVGFEMRLAPKLFKAFQRLHGESEFAGVGMGLAIVEKIVSRHGGRVWADSSPENGTAFYFGLPSETTAMS